MEIILIITLLAICVLKLINQYTILTAGHCIIKAFNYASYNIYTFPFYPTLESMFEIYVGLHNISNIYDIEPYRVKQIIKVNLFTSTLLTAKLPLWLVRYARTQNFIIPFI